MNDQTDHNGTERQCTHIRWSYDDRDAVTCGNFTTENQSFCDECKYTTCYNSTPIVKLRHK